VTSLTNQNSVYIHKQSDSLAGGPKLLSIKSTYNYIQLINGWRTNYWLLPTRWCNISHFKCEHARNWKFFKGRVISKNLWPHRSPDITPADFFLWGLLKSKVYKNTPRTIEQLKDAIRQEIQAVNVDALGKVFQNLESRIQVCLDVKGDQFQHRLW